MITGIYKIQNRQNQKLYIGSSFDVNGRWQDHECMLRNNYHHSIHLQNAWNKYGSENFEFSVIEQCSNEELLIREQHYLDTVLKAQEYIMSGDSYFLENGYNIKPTAGSNRGFRHTRETIEKILETRGLHVIAVDEKGEHLGQFLSTKIAADFFEIGVTRVQKSINKRQFPKGLRIGFIYKKDYSEGFVPKESRTGDVKGSVKGKLWQPVHVFTIYGKFVETVDNQLLCANKYSMNAANMCRLLNNPIKKKCNMRTNNKFLFSRTPDSSYLSSVREQYKKVESLGLEKAKYVIKTSDGQLIAYSNEKGKIADAIGCHVNALSGVITGSRNLIKGYKIEMNQDIV